MVTQPVVTLIGIVNATRAVSAGAGTSAYHGFHGGSRDLLIAAGIAAAVWLVIFTIRLTASFPDLPAPGPDSMELGPEPPAVSNLLVNRWHVTRAALPATLVDLAAKGALSIDEVAPDHFLIRLTPQRGQRVVGTLTPYEKQLLELVQSRASHDVAPVEAIDLGDEGQAKRWWKTFCGSVESDARHRGLARSRWTAFDRILLGVGLAIVLALAAGALASAHVGELTKAAQATTSRERNWSPADWFYAAGFLWLIAAVAFTSLRGIRDTADGRASCARWLGIRNFLRKDAIFADANPAAVAIWDHYLAQGVGLGVARAAARALPMGDEDPHHAWSSYGGGWHQVHIEYPRRFGYGGTPIGVFLGGVIRSLFFGGLAFVALPIVVRGAWSVADDALNRRTDNATLALVGVFVVVFGGIACYLIAHLIDGLVRLARGALDLRRRVELRGEVVRIGVEAPFTGYIAVDDGQAPTTKAFRLPANAPRVGRGDEVTVLLSPHLRHAFAMSLLHANAAVPTTSGSTRAQPWPAPGQGRHDLAGGPDAAIPSEAITLERASAIVGRPLQAAPGIPTVGGRLRAASAFTDGAAGRVMIGVVDLPTGGAAAGLLTMMARKAAERGSKVDVSPGVTGTWVRDNTLMVPAGSSMTVAVVELPGVDSAARLHIAQQLVGSVVPA